MDPLTHGRESQLQSEPHVKIVFPEIRKVTLVLDGSASSLQACEAAAIVAKGLKATVTAAYVLPPRIGIGLAPPPSEHARASIERAMSLLTSYEGVSATSEILEPHSLSVSESLIEYLAKEKSDLVVCGNKGHGGFERMLLGSFSSTLATHSPCSVMVVRNSKAGEEKIKLCRILVATDGLESASKAAGFAISLTKALSLKLTFINVVFLHTVNVPALILIGVLYRLSRLWSTIAMDV